MVNLIGKSPNAPVYWRKLPSDAEDCPDVQSESSLLEAVISPLPKGFLIRALLTGSMVCEPLTCQGPDRCRNGK